VAWASRPGIRLAKTQPNWLRTGPSNLQATWHPKPAQPTLIGHVNRATLYFPLRSSVEFFDDPTLVRVGTSAKEGAVLFDEVLFEAGMVIANIEDASFTIYRPGHELGPDDLPPRPTAPILEADPLSLAA
jgi:hypothetical protein